MKNSGQGFISPSLLLKMGAWRPPVFMVDRIIDFSPGPKGYITVIKHVTFNEPYISGHFPDNPVMPGIKITEIFGQASEYLSLLSDYVSMVKSPDGNNMKKLSEIVESLDKKENVKRLISERERIFGFLTSQDVKFRQVVYPGDTIEATSRLLHSDAKGFCHYLVEARVGRNIVCTGKIVNLRVENNKKSNI